MATAVGAAESILGKLLTKLSDELVAAYVASSELGLDSEQISRDLEMTQALLHQSRGRDIGHNPGFSGLLGKLAEKAGQADDALSELQYFMIQDQLDGTQLVKPDLDGSRNVNEAHARHAVGNWLPCFSCPFSTKPLHESKSDSGDQVEKLAFDSVSMSVRIKSSIEEVHSICIALFDLLKIQNHSSTAVISRRPIVGSAFVQDRLYGRSAIFEQTIGLITSCRETLSVLPVVGPGGIGKTTFIQHLYNDARTEHHFTIMIWVCVSTDFDVLKLTHEILRSIPATKEEGSSSAVDKMANLDQLQMSIAKRLKSKRFLLVLDDVWKCNSEADWNTLLAPFTKGETKGNVVLVTTRFPRIAEMTRTVDPIKLHGLDTEDFLEFFEACIFGDRNKPEHYGDELTDIAKNIAKMLKGSPLAAKTVGRLLRKDLSSEYWMGVLESKAWENTQNSDDIMSSLYMSYDYLPFLLQKCFSYCSLFPEGYRFSNSEMNRFWIAVGIIDSKHLGNNYLEELVDNGFLMRVDGLSGKNYAMHDLMHELSQSVSTLECLNISIPHFKAETVPPSVRHLSITLDNIYDENFQEQMGKLKRKIDIPNLRTLMIFREYEESIAEILKETFKEVTNLHVLFMVVKSLDDLPQTFSKLIHLQYLKFGSPCGIDITLPSTLSRFYHMKFLDLEDWHGSSNLPKDICRLVNLQSFLAKKELHSSVPEVGKMKYLRELKKFCVKKERLGFELKELGELTELGGELTICNLENVATKEEASEAKLMSKKNLKRLTLVWGRNQLTVDADILDALQPHPDLQEIHIANYGGAVCPSWFCVTFC